MCFSFSKVQATDSVFSDVDLTRDNLKSVAEANTFNTIIDVVPITLKISKSNYKTNNGKVYWSITDTNYNYKDIYCLNLSRGFGSPNGSITDSNNTKQYTTKYLSNNSNFATYTGLNDEQKNKVLWILNNSATSEEGLTELLRKASEKVDINSIGLLNKEIENFIKNDMKSNNEEKTKLTFDDIKIVQQIAIWNYTNSDSVFKNTIGSICDSEGNEISDLGENIDIDGYGTYIRSGKVKQAKFNALYKYFIDGASSASSTQTTTPSLSLSNDDADVEEDENYYIAGPFSLNGENTERIKEVTANVNVQSYKLLDVDKKEVTNNEFSKVIGNKFYLKISKNQINQDTTINIDMNYKYDIKTLTFMTDESDPANTQPVVLVESEEKNISINTEITIDITEVDVVKDWDDSDNQDGIRTSSVKVQLYENGVEKGNPIELNSTNNWSYTWTKLLEGKIYTVQEVNVPTGYEAEVSGSMTEGFKITNRHTPETINIEGTKTWEDSNNQDGKRPESITVNLLANGTKISSKEVTGPNWNYSFTNLPKYKDGTEIVYTVDEESVEGYTKTIEGYNLKNTYTTQKIEKTVTKVWDDNNNQDRKRASYGVTLFANGEVYGEEIVLDENTLSYTWQNLPKYKNGAEIKYTVRETTVPKEYTANYSEDTFTITNKYTPGKVSKTVIKSWEDSNNEDGIRPRSVEVQLYKTVNGIKASMGDEYKVDLKEDNNWTYTWANLNEKEDGIDIVYSVEETNVPSEYTVTYSSDDYSDIDIIRITNTHDVEEPTGKYNVVLRKVDNSGNPLTGAKIKVNGKEYTVGSAKIAEDVNIFSEDPITLEYTLEELTPPEGYLGLSSAKDIKIKLEIERLDKTYNVKRAYLVNANGEQITDSEIKVMLDATTSTITINVINNPIQPEFDLALRKFITKINNETYSREPQVDTSTIATTRTATYKHTKAPLAVQVGDKVTYTIRVYNEGETDGYVGEITDYLPEWLDFLPDDETNKTYLWTQDIKNNRKITTNITSKDSASGEELYKDRQNKQLLSAYDGGEKLDYIDVQIVCQVNDKAPVKQLITNIAEISKMQDKEGTEVITDRDSTRANVNLPADVDLPDYKGNEDNNEDLTNGNYYYKGQEDDDDFEKVIVETFDLSLRKFITTVNKESITPSREPQVDTSKLGTKDEDGNIITTATYAHSKEPVKVKKGDIVTYTIRVYNEGTLAGYANEITDYIPEGLEFIEDSSINVANEWKMLDANGNETNDSSKAVKITTDTKSEEKEKVYMQGYGEYNLISGYNSETMKSLDYVDVQVQFRVVADPVEYADSIITNWAEISEDSNNDIDTTPGNSNKDEDDIDYEPIELTYFDLSLRKFITKVDEIDYNNRVPQVDTSKIGTIDEETGKKITTAIYTHTKDPIVLETGSTVIYTIRVYNEGTVAGYASEITDNIPEGLEFLPENKTNSDYKWTMIDEEGNITQDVSKAVKITTNYLSEENDSSNIISAYQESDGNIALDYKDIEVAFKVTEPNNSDRIVVNTAQISKDSDDDIDSIPGNDILTEDDIDREYVKVQTFDLALQKWVTATKLTYNGKTKTTKTGFDENSNEMAKVDLVSSQLKKTTVKFVYCIRVFNEGQVAGYATEIKDYVPSGLKFVAEDNPDWTLQKDGTVTTDKLKDTLLEPGQSATVEITLTWKNSSTNMGLKTNWAEISKDSGDDIDSTPDNYNKLEDDIDDAKVILSIKTGSVKMYIALAIISISILGGGTFLIKKYVIDK